MVKILVIDDNDGFREPFCELLERAGYEVIDAPNGKVGIEKCYEQPVDLVITDILMPEKEGVETIHDLKTLFPKIKIIAISGGGVVSAEGYLETVESFLQIKYGFSKPIKMAEIIAAIEDLLGADKKECEK